MTKLLEIARVDGFAETQDGETMTVEIGRSDRVAFWFPIILPVVVGLVYGFTDLASNLGATGIIIAEPTEQAERNMQLQSLLRSDGFSLWDASITGIVTAVFSIHIWALSTLFASDNGGRSSAAFAYPVVGIFVNFFLVSIVVGITDLVEGVQISNMLVQAVSESGTTAPIIPGELIVMRMIASAAALLAVAVGWYVRRGIWLHHESVYSPTS